jgi:hypothetical protein
MKGSIFLVAVLYLPCCALGSAVLTSGALASPVQQAAGQVEAEASFRSIWMRIDEIEQVIRIRGGSSVAAPAAEPTGPTVPITFEVSSFKQTTRNQSMSTNLIFVGDQVSVHHLRPKSGPPVKVRFSRSQS